MEQVKDQPLFDAEKETYWEYLCSLAKTNQEEFRREGKRLDKMESDAITARAQEMWLRAKERFL